MQKYPLLKWEITALTGIAVIAGMGIGMIKDYEKIIEGNRQLRWQYEAREEGTENWKIRETCRKVSSGDGVPWSRL